MESDMDRPNGQQAGRLTEESRARQQKVRSKTRASRKSQESVAPSSTPNGRALLDERQRREMIATGAFLRAQRRGFESGAELEDWLAAEEEIDRWLELVDRGPEEPPLFEE